MGTKKRKNSSVDYYLAIRPLVSIFECGDDAACIVIKYKKMR
jgi:hypothetical protein